MAEKHLIICYFITLALLATNVLLVLFRHYKLINIIGVLIMLSSVCSYIGTYLVSGHVPVYNKFATLQNIVLIVSFLGVIYNKTPGDRSNNINAIWLCAFALQAYILTRDMTVNSDYYMYDKLYVVCFFQFRITAIGLFVFAMVNQLSVFFTSNNSNIETLLYRARNFTMLGAVFYLAGEFSGSYWCFLWWGDPWHWSKGFFLASAMFLLSMLGSHLPAVWLKLKKNRAIASIIPTTAILVIYLISH